MVLAITQTHLEHLECSHQPHTQGRGARRGEEHTLVRVRVQVRFFEGATPPAPLNPFYPSHTVEVSVFIYLFSATKERILQQSSLGLARHWARDFDTGLARTGTNTGTSGGARGPPEEAPCAAQQCGNTAKFTGLRLR